MAFNYKTEYERYRRYYQAIEPIITKPKTYAYTTAVFSFLAISLFGWYAIRPTLQTILFLRREIADNILVNKQMEDKIISLIEAQAAYQEVESQLPSVAQALPSDPDVIPLVVQLRNLARNTESSLSAIQVPTVPLLGQDASISATKSLSGNLIDIPIVVSTNGSYTAIRSFLNGLLEMRRIVTVETLSLAPVLDETGVDNKPMLKLVLKLKTYYHIK